MLATHKMVSGSEFQWEDTNCETVTWSHSIMIAPIVIKVVCIDWSLGYCLMFLTLSWTSQPPGSLWCTCAPRGLWAGKLKSIWTLLSSAVEETGQISPFLTSHFANSSRSVQLKGHGLWVCIVCVMHKPFHETHAVPCITCMSHALCMHITCTLHACRMLHMHFICTFTIGRLRMQQFHILYTHCVSVQTCPSPRPPRTYDWRGLWPRATLDYSWRKKLLLGSGNWPRTLLLISRNTVNSIQN